MQSQRIYCADELALQQFAGEFYRQYLADVSRVVIYLQGELGAGKTTFVRALLRHLGYTGKVKSPTYTLMETYQVGQQQILHLDLYRMGHIEEVEYLGLRDYIAEPAFWLIEWPSRGAGELPPADVIIKFEVADAGRWLEITTGL